ncbi:hypothetical protein ACE6H2_014793 [Prunus campanulata]
MSSGDDSKVPSSQVPLYLWGGSLVHNKRFVANLHRMTTEAQFQKWRAAYASAIPDDVQVNLVKYRADDTPCADASDPNARIITFRPFYFSLGFTFPLSRLFKEVFCAMECAPSQCTPNVYWAIKCFENLSRFFTLELTVREFFYFFQVRHFEDYAQVRIYKAKLFDSLSQGDHAWHDDVLEVSGRWEGDVGDGPLVPIIYCNVWLTNSYLLLVASSISKQLKLGPDMAKVRRALSIPPKFREWRWLLSEYREEDGGLTTAKDVEKWKENGPDPLDLLVGQEECSAESLSKRKVAATSSRHEATSSRAKDDASPLRKKPRLPSAEKTQARSAPSSSARVEKTQAGSIPSSSAKVKHLVRADSRKVGENHDLLHEVVRARSRSTEHQRDADIPHQSSSHPHQLVVETRAAKRGVDSTSLTSLQARLAEAKKMRESSARAKGSSSVSAVDPKVNKSSPAGDARVSDLLKTNFLSNPSSCAELVDHIRQAGDLGTFSSLYLENQREVAFHLLQKGLIFAAQTVQNSFAVAPSSAQLSELEKKNVELASKLFTEQARCEKKTSDLRAMISELKSSLAEKDSELNSSAADLVSRKDAFFRLERKNADISLSYEKLLARFRAHHESAERSKSEATIDAYKLGYLHCADGIASLYAIEDADIETLCPDIFRVQDRAEEDEMMADVAEQAGEAAEGMADQADAEKAADQGPPTGVSK